MTDLIFSTGLEWGVPPEGDQGGQGGLLFYVVTRGGQWSYKSPLKFGNQIQHGDDSVGYLEDALLRKIVGTTDFLVHKLFDLRKIFLGLMFDLRKKHFQKI